MDKSKYTNLFRAKPKECPAFCDCEFPNSLELNSHDGNVLDMVKCRCGEENWHAMDWMWHKGEADAHIDGTDVTFHPIFSQGTAIVRGERELAMGMVHFWEMRMITPLSGTDVMFGIGTDDFDLQAYRFHFLSPLGSNKKSWGYSYHGHIQYDACKRNYGQRITQGCIVGIYLDRLRGCLEFFLNRRSLGVAFVNIPLDPDVKLYPMVSSTAAKSIIRLINATSQPECLQMHAFKALSKNAQALQSLRKMPGFTKLLRDYWFFTPPTRYSQRRPELDFDLLDIAVLPKNARLKRRQTYDADKIYTIKEDEENEIDENDANFYPNPRKIPMHDLLAENDFDFFDEFLTTFSRRDFH